MDPKKIRAITEWLTPKNISEVLFFLGLQTFIADLLNNI